MTCVVGIDPGLNYTGWAVVKDHAKGYEVLGSGVIRPPKGELSARLGFIGQALQRLLTEYAPDRGACEKTFVNINPQSTLLLGQARGSALCVMALAGLSVDEFTPSEIKLAVTGNGRADKLMVSAMVQKLCNLSVVPQEDEADAIACAICGINASKLQRVQARGISHKTYATARRGRTQARAREAWTQQLLKQGH